MADVEDPLEGYRGLSLFPQTFASLSNPPKPYDPDDDLHCLHNFLISLPVQNSDKLLEQAKNFLDSSSEPPITQMLNDTVSEGNHDFDVKKVVESPRGQRPGLGRKRARFSLLSNSSQPTVNFEPTLDVDKLKDPEEFFLAFERLENAKREIARQIGCVSIDSNQCSTSMFPRTRQPGILGRSRMVKYKHLYPTMSSQGRFQENMLNPSNSSTQRETVYPDCSSQETEPANAALQQGEPANVASEEMEGSMAKAENGVDKLLDDLLAHDYEELDGDGALTLLQERLQVKPLDIDKLNLPELQDIQKIDSKALGQNLPKCKNVLPDVRNLLKGTRRINPLKQKEADSSIPCFGSSTPKSPLASLSLLKKHILLSNPSSDPFSAADIDQSLENNTFTLKNIEKCSHSVDLEKELTISLKLSTLTVEKDDRAVCNMSSAKVAVGKSNNPSDKSVNDNLNGLGSDGVAGASEFLADSGANNVVKGNGNFTCLDANEGFGTTRRDKSEGMAEDVLQEAGTTAQPDLNKDELSKEMLSNNQNQFDQLASAVVEEHAIDGFSKTDVTAPAQTQDAASEHHNNQEPTLVTINEVVTTNEETKAKSHSLKKRKNSISLSRTQSLAASGTSWETGVRRSTRIRSRPLEYWKGERFLYGRIHGSLATVIGIKYESPRKDNGKPTIKVKSFVPDKYKDLIKLAALH